MTTSIAEINSMTDAEKLYRIWERMEEMYCLNFDWENAMKCKWLLAITWAH